MHTKKNAKWPPEESICPTEEASVPQKKDSVAIETEWCSQLMLASLGQ